LIGKTRRQYGVFISHTRVDKEFARRLAHDLEFLGLSVWFDEWELRVGDSILDRISDGIEKSQWMIVVLSPEALTSEWVKRELRDGLTKEIGTKTVFVLPALYRRVTPPSFLRDKFYADFTGSYEKGLALLRDRLLRSYEKHGTDQWLSVRRPIPGAVIDNIDAASRMERIPDDSIKHLYQLADYSVRQVMALTVRTTLHEKALKLDKELSSDQELWFGRTGRLILRTNGQTINGDYDWHGLSLAGRIHGGRKNGIIRFAWDWSRSSEQGRGVFWTDIPNVLYGGWWPDYHDIDEEDIELKRRPPPNTWEFVDVTGLRITTSDHDPGERNSEDA